MASGVVQMRDVYPILDLLDLVVAESEGLAEEESRRQAATTAAAARQRRAFFSHAVVAAIAGGTGSGKSSLLNAIAGAPIASTSTLRPHTDAPLAWIPAREPVIAAMLAERGVDAVVEHDDGGAIALVDLPDLDSVDDRHRATVEQILPIVDAVIWVFDPVKYHDPSIHEEFLATANTYEDVFVFVLNKIDRLDEGEAEAITTHLTGLLERDGFRSPTVHAVAAAPASGNPVGIAPLVDALERRLIGKRADRAKLVADLLGAGRRIADDAGVWTGIPEGAHERIRRAVSDEAPLGPELDALGVGGTVVGALSAAGGDDAAVAGLLRRRAVLAATVAALGVSCAEVRAEATERTR
jgi:energy-coupling factor transporter ATP-binding protein EcfA2